MSLSREIFQLSLINRSGIVVIAGFLLRFLSLGAVAQICLFKNAAGLRAGGNGFSALNGGAELEFVVF